MLVTFLLASTLAGPAAPELSEYRVKGDDLYSVGQTPTVARIVYSGTQSLAVTADGRGFRFVATARCTRTDATGSSVEQARFVQEMSPDGTFEDRSNDDPDFLTILNQPFAIRLDAATIGELRQLRGAVPFEAASPVGGGSLHGSLRPGPPALMHGRRVVGVRFVADGLVNGPLAGYASTVINGKVHLDGSAYYDVVTAGLQALDARLTINGRLGTDSATAVPVRIVYRRVILSEP